MDIRVPNVLRMTMWTLRGHVTSWRGKYIIANGLTEIIIFQNLLIGVC